MKHSMFRDFHLSLESKIIHGHYAGKQGQITHKAVRAEESWNPTDITQNAIFGNKHLNNDNLCMFILFRRKVSMSASLSPVNGSKVHHNLRSGLLHIHNEQNSRRRHKYPDEKNKFM